MIIKKHSGINGCLVRKKFNIEVISKKPKKLAGKLCHQGQITIGDSSEKFYMVIDDWSLDDYKQQWKEGIERIKTHDSSCLIANITELKTNPRMSFWVLYKVGKIIFVQYQALGCEVLKEREVGLPPYDSKTCYLYLLPRRTVNAYGDKYDEWSINLDDFLASIDKIK